MAVIGAGGNLELGSDIADAAARAGYRTILADILPASLRRADHRIRTAAGEAIESESLSLAGAESLPSRLEYAATMEEAARAADLVIEAVPDEMESKLEIFALLDRISKPHTLLASTTIWLNLSEIASITCRSAKILGMRFRCPVAEMRTLELVRLPETENETLAACSEVSRRMGKEIVVTTEQ